VRLARALLAHASAALTTLLEFSQPADEVLSRYFRGNPMLGQQDRAFVAEVSFAVLRRMRSLEAAAGSREPRALLLAALTRVMGLSGRALEGVLEEGEDALVARIKAARTDTLPGAVRADLPDWLWDRLAADHGEAEAMRIAQGLLNPAPLDLRVNLARTGRDEALKALLEAGVEGALTKYSPAGIRLAGKPAINRNRLFADGLVEVQDEGSQLLASLLAPRRGEMVADYCAGAGGKTLAISMLMRGSGRVYAMDVSAKRLAALAPRVGRAGVTNVHTIALSGDHDARVKRLARKMDRVLVDAPCSGFGTLRRNPDLKWRHAPGAIEELARKQSRILDSAATLVKPAGRLVYATCSILRAENEVVAEEFLARHPDFKALSCDEILTAQRIPLQAGAQLRLWPHLHATDGFFAAAFERVA
jgi:16S rRNA (cytosine967-C5)-methyltransferase